MKYGEEAEQAGVTAITGYSDLDMKIIIDDDDTEEEEIKKKVKKPKTKTRNRNRNSSMKWRRKLRSFNLQEEDLPRFIPGE